MRAALPALAAVLALALVGCGGSGGRSSGGYRGTFTEKTTVAIPSDLGYSPAPNGRATATLGGTGRLQVTLADGCKLTGVVGADGTVTDGLLSYPRGATTAGGTLTATIAVQQSGADLGVFASVYVDSTASADYTIELTRS